MTLKEMVDSGMLVQRHLTQDPRSIAKEDVDDLVRRLRALVPPKETRSNGSSVMVDDLFLQAFATPSQKAGFFGLLVDRPGCVIGLKGRGFCAGRLLLSPAAIRMFEKELLGDEEFVTAQYAARRLQCSADVIKGAKRAGHFVLGCRRGREAISMKSLLEFEAKYEVLSSVVRRMGCCIRRTYAGLDMTRVGHITVAGCQVSTVFICRNDMARAEAAIFELERARASGGSCPSRERTLLGRV